MTKPSPTVSPASVTVGDDGTVSSLTYGDVYHARAGAIEQARYVFLDGNGLLPPQARWHDHEQFVILETGFGLGLNFLATWQAWRASRARGQLHFVSVEQHPFERAPLTALLAAYGEVSDLAAALIAHWPLPIAGVHRLHFDQDSVTLTLAFGDAATVLPTLALQADVVYLDGFSPAQNPQMWSPKVLGAVTRLCRPNATLATWCVNGEVRRQLSYRGWQVARTPGFADKREMLRGVLQKIATQVNSEARPPSVSGLGFAQPRPGDGHGAVLRETPIAVSPAPTCGHVVVLGAGLAGCCLTERLVAHGFNVTLVDRHPAPAMAASGNPAGILLPRLALDDALGARLARQAFLYARHRLDQLDDVEWSACGVLQIAEDATEEAYQREAIARLALPETFAHYLDQSQASQRLGMNTAHGGWWFPAGAWVSPSSFCKALLRRSEHRVEQCISAAVAGITHSEGLWRLIDASGKEIAQAPHLVLANAHEVSAFNAQSGSEGLPIEAVRGQISQLPASALPGLNHVLCGAAYATPAVNGFACIGATFGRHDTGLDVRSADHADNLARLHRLLPEASQLRALDPEALSGRAGFRCMTRDKLPIVGALARAEVTIDTNSTLSSIPRVPGLHVLTGLGARGLLWAPLAAELLACQLSGAPSPLTRAMIDALDPARFVLRSRRKT